MEIEVYWNTHHIFPCRLSYPPPTCNPLPRPKPVAEKLPLLLFFSFSDIKVTVHIPKSNTTHFESGQSTLTIGYAVVKFNSLSTQTIKTKTKSMFKNLLNFDLMFACNSWYISGSSFLHSSFFLVCIRINTSCETGKLKK